MKDDDESARPRRNAADGKRGLRGTGRNLSSDDEAICLSQGQTVGPTISAVPCGVLAQIFEGLGPRDLASASCVCQAWRHLVALEAAANLVWRSFYSARWQLSGAVWPKPVPTAIPTPTPKQPLDRGGAGPSGSPSSASRDCSGVASSSCSSSPACSLSSSPELRWQWAYGSKMLRLRSWSGRYSADQVVGHKSAVRAVRLLSSVNLLATASLDRTVRLWDLAAGLPLACSRPHGGTVRCLALDPSLLASGCSDNLVRVWHPRTAGGSGPAAASAMPLYDISSKPHLLRGHTGPVSCLALDETSAGADASTAAIFSGSWDCTVRIWRQRNNDGGCDGGSNDEGSDTDGYGRSGGESSENIFGVSGDGETTSDEGSSGSGGGAAAATVAGAATAALTARRRARRAAAAAASGSGREDGGWSCSGVLQYGDWVYCCAVRGGNLLVAAGSEVVVTDAATGRVVRRFADLHDGGSVACLEGCRSGRLLFTAGSGDGLLLAHDLRMKQGSRVLWHHNAAVTGLAFEDPWLASSSADGCIILQDSEQALAGGGGPQRALNASCRALHCPAGQPALCLDLADQWLAAGTDSGVVRLWDFTGAAAAAERAASSRAARSAGKSSRTSARRQLQQPQPQLQPLQPQQRQPSQRPIMGGQGFMQPPGNVVIDFGAAGSGAAVFTSPGSAFSGLDATTGGGSGGQPGPSSLQLLSSSPPSAVLQPSSHLEPHARKLRGAGSCGGGGGGSIQRWRHGHSGSQHPHTAHQLVNQPQPQAGYAHYHQLHHAHSQQQQQPQQLHQQRIRTRALGPSPPQAQGPVFRYVATGPAGCTVADGGAVPPATRGGSGGGLAAGGAVGGSGGVPASPPLLGFTK